MPVLPLTEGAPLNKNHRVPLHSEPVVAGPQELVSGQRPLKLVSINGVGVGQFQHSGA
jgi:hypothetical protein